jgi:hypothetical protein
MTGRIVVEEAPMSTEEENKAQRQTALRELLEFCHEKKYSAYAGATAGLYLAALAAHDGLEERDPDAFAQNAKAIFECVAAQAKRSEEDRPRYLN